MNSLIAKTLLENWATWYMPKPVPWLRYRTGQSQSPELQAEWVDLLASHTQGAHKQVARMLEDMADKPPNLLQMRKMLRDAEAKVLPADHDTAPNMGECPTCNGLGWVFDTMTTPLGTYSCVDACTRCNKTGLVPSRQAAKREPVRLADAQRALANTSHSNEDF